MKFWDFVLRCLVVFVIAFATAILASLLFFLIIHGKADVEWRITFYIAATIGFVLPLSDLIKIGKK